MHYTPRIVFAHTRLTIMNKLNKLSRNISQSEISNIATDCKSDNKK